MNLLRNLSIVFAVVTALPALAGDVLEFAGTRLSSSVQLAEAYLAAKNLADADQKMNAFVLSQPGGLTFASHALTLILRDESPYFKTQENRTVLTKWVAANLRGHPPQDFNSPIVHRIRAQARELLAKHPSYGEHQKVVLELFWSLNLWNEMDAEFLAKKVINREGVWQQFLAPLIEGVPYAPASMKEFIAMKTRQVTNRNLINMLVLYQTGLMAENDYTWLFRYLMDAVIAPERDGSVIALSQSFQSPIVEERVAAGKMAFEELKTQVMNALQDQLNNGYEPVVHAFNLLRNTLKSETAWPGRVLTADEQARGESFLLSLKNDAILQRCEQDLRLR